MIEKFIQSKLFWPVIWGVSFLLSGNIILIISNITKEAMLFSYLPRTLGTTLGFVLFPFILTSLFIWGSRKKDKKESKKYRFRKYFLSAWIIISALVVYGWTL
jgi:uncharacterized membrane protein